MLTRLLKEKTYHGIKEVRVAELSNILEEVEVLEEWEVCDTRRLVVIGEIKGAGVYEVGAKLENGVVVVGALICVEAFTGLVATDDGESSLVDFFGVVYIIFAYLQGRSHDVSRVT